jgi:hypothetical protein
MRKYTNEQLIESCKNSTSIRQVLINLGLAPEGGSYRTIHKYIKTLGIDTSHFTGQGWSKGKAWAPKKSIEEYLSNQQSIQSHKLRLRLLREHILPFECSSCSLTEWKGQPIPLELDHIDGNHNNNILSNLRLLCPNCHAQTSTYTGRNKGKASYSVA